jgi:hypothetical protein
MSAKRRPESQLTAATAEQDDDGGDEPGKFAKADASSLQARKYVAPVRSPLRPLYLYLYLYLCPCGAVERKKGREREREGGEIFEIFSGFFSVLSSFGYLSSAVRRTLSRIDAIIVRHRC